MLETKRKKAEVWKDPSMALTFHGLEQDGDSTARVNKINHMELVARGVKCYIGANGRRELEASPVQVAISRVEASRGTDLIEVEMLAVAVASVSPVRMLPHAFCGNRHRHHQLASFSPHGAAGIHSTCPSPQVRARLHR
jgi:hypothetical protein